MLKMGKIFFICLVLSELYSAGKAQNQICREFFCRQSGDWKYSNQLQVKLILILKSLERICGHNENLDKLKASSDIFKVAGRMIKCFLTPENYVTDILRVRLRLLALTNILYKIPNCYDK